MKLLMILLIFITVVSFFKLFGEKTEPMILARLKAGKTVTVGDIIITPHKDWKEGNPIFYIWNRQETSAMSGLKDQQDERQDIKTEKTAMVMRDRFRYRVLNEE
ncbi:MAG: hypothetical protein HY755_08685 [Nitrospirae bacterium]|nr:hypothetical protein [Nitrospirota bacterium]